MLQHEDNEVSEDRRKQPLGAEAAEIHTKVFTEYAQIKRGAHIFRQHQQRTEQPLFLSLAHFLFSRTLPAAVPQAGDGHDENDAVGEPGQEERGRGFFPIEQDKLSRDKGRQEVGQFAENRFVTGQFRTQ